MSLFRAGGSNYIGIRDLPAATSWYIDKLGLRKVTVDLDDGDDCVALGFSKDEPAIVLGPQGKPTEESGPLLYTSKLEKAREWLASRGIQTTEIKEDGQGTHYFEMRDLEGNTIEISEEP
jgi:catechol 2,3-dioxygenase-like lactoylglutathione lyase family enzyme